MTRQQEIQDFMNRANDLIAIATASKIVDFKLYKDLRQMRKKIITRMKEYVDNS